MKPFFALLALALFLLVPTRALHAQGPRRQGAWILDDLPAAQREARRTGKAIFVVLRCER